MSDVLKLAAEILKVPAVEIQFGDLLKKLLEQKSSLLEFFKELIKYRPFCDEAEVIPCKEELLFYGVFGLMYEITFQNDLCCSQIDRIYQNIWDQTMLLFGDWWVFWKYLETTPPNWIID